MHSPDPNTELKAHLRGSPLFQNLAEATLDRLAQAASVREVPAATNIFERNSPGDEFYLVLEGRVELIIPTHPSVPDDPLRDKLMKNATDAVVDTREAGEAFGELACLVENGTRTATAHAPRPCRLLVIPKGPFIQTLREVPEAAFVVLRQVADRLRWHTDHLAKTVRKEGLTRPEDRAVRDKANRTWWQTLADGAIGLFAHPICTLVHALWWLYWFTHLGQTIPFTKWVMDVDLLTNIVSLEAIVLAIAILVAQRRKDDKDASREATHFSNTAVSVEQTTVILHRLIQLEAELRHERLKGSLRHRRDQPPTQAPAPCP